MIYQFNPDQLLKFIILGCYYTNLSQQQNFFPVLSVYNAVLVCDRLLHSHCSAALAGLTLAAGIP